MLKICPTCKSSNVKKYDVAKRLVKTKGGTKKWIDITRYKCTDCGSIHRDLPDNISPFKHYDNDIIKGVVEGFISSDTLGYEDYPCEITMKRWREKDL